MKLEELLADTEKVKDTLELELPGMGKFTVGDLRKLHSNVAEQEKTIQARVKELDAERQRLSEVGAQGAALLEELNRLKEADAQKPAPKREGDIDFDTDPVYGPLVSKKLKPLEERLTKLQTTFEETARNILEMSKAYLTDFYETRWNTIPVADRPKDRNWKHYLKIAADNKILDPLGRPDPVEAFMREVKPQQEATIRDENAKLKTEIEELKKQASAPRMPRPGSVGVPAGARKEEKRYGSVDEMISDAFSDNEILDIMSRGAAS